MEIMTFSHSHFLLYFSSFKNDQRAVTGMERISRNASNCGRRFENAPVRNAKGDNQQMSRNQSYGYVNSSTFPF